MNVRECAELLQKQDQFLIITHKRPDGDTLGSSAALCRGLRRMGKQAFLFPNPQVTDTYMPTVEPYFAPVGFAPEYVIAVDCADSGMFTQGFDGHVDMAIDHHPANPGYADHTLVMAEKAACGEIVLLVLKELGCGIDEEMASAMYMAISTDTGCYAYSNTTADCHRATAELMELGAKSQSLNKILFRTSTAARLQLEGMVYTSLRRFHNGEINFAVITLDMMAKAGCTEDDCDDLASLPGKIKGNKISATIRELEPGFCKVSVRTGTEIDASAVCAKFGGGGHKMAAGCELRATPDETVEQLLKAVYEVWK